MAHTTTMTLRIDAAMRRRLERLARATARSKAFLAQEAIRAYVDLHEWQVQAIEEGVRAADAGDLVDDDEVTAWLESWGRPGERKRR
jgi:RHH-type rel operon transcriptional repressor/antitoxin RelB